MAKTQKKSRTAVKAARKAGSRAKKGGVAARARERSTGGAPSPAARGKLERVRMPQASKSSAEESNEGRYVYCVIQSERPLSFGLLGIGPEPAEVHTVPYRDIAAVVSITPIVVQEPTRDNVLAHQRVNETVMQQHTVIPMSFGTVFKTDEDIIELLRSAYDAFTDVLNKMQIGRAHV